MTIKYVLQRNEAILDQHQCIARVQHSGKADLEDVIDYMMQTATVAKPDVVGVLEGFFTAIENLVLDGKVVSTPAAVFRASVRGIFVDEADGFDPSRHRIHASVSPGVRLRKAMRNRGQVAKGRRFDLRPTPKRYTDIETGTVNEILTPGGQGSLLGDLLRFNPDDPEQGIFFLAEDGSAVRVAQTARNMPSELIFLVPDLVAGEYTLEVRVSFNDDGDLLVGELAAKLTVSG